MIPKELLITELKEVAKSNWKYILYQYHNSYILSVACGSVGLYDVNIALDKSEEDKYISKGADFLRELSDAISYSPNSYLDRHVNIVND